MVGEPFLAGNRMARRLGIVVVAGGNCRGASPPFTATRRASLLPVISSPIMVTVRDCLRLRPRPVQRPIHVQTRETWMDVDKQTTTLRYGPALRSLNAHKHPQPPRGAQPCGDKAGPDSAVCGHPGTLRRWRRPTLGPHRLRHGEYEEGSGTYPFADTPETNPGCPGQAKFYPENGTSALVVH
jgi:hypothetical protein